MIDPDELTPEEIEALIENIDKFSPEEQAEIAKILDVLEKRQAAQRCRDDLIEFCKAMDPNYKVGKHHRRLADLLMAMERGEEDRIGVSVPPRHGKSQLVSIFFPAWYLGRNPDKKVLMVSHTADLAVDFGRKVRNLVASEAYKDIFPTVTLAADSKSAGRWNTNMGGEYFACLRRYALVHTTAGLIPAGRIEVGDILLNAGKPVTVREVYNSKHNATYHVHGLECSAKHPIWTMNRGWVYASEVQPNDVLCVESISDTMKALVWRVYGYLEHTYVPPMVQHQVPLHQPQQRKMGELRWAWNHTVRTVAYIRELFTGYWAPAIPTSHGGSDRQRWAVQSRELSLGDIAPTAKQQAQQRQNQRQDFGRTRQRAWGDTGSDTLSYGQQPKSINPQQTAQEELRTYGNPEGIGWLRSAATRIITRCSQIRSSRQPGSGAQGHMAGVKRAAEKLFGLLLGVRRAGNIKVVHHKTPQHFVNFLTDGDHTFFADGVLTHNCGVGAALAGRGAHFLIIDDPFSEQDVINGNYEVFEKAYEWFTYGARTRLMPQGKVAIVHCMTGDTGVLMADGTEKPLREVRPGDCVATYDRGEITTAKVLNWANQGLDKVYAIHMTSGTIVRANERHPFLVNEAGELKWIKVKHLKPNMTVVKIGKANGQGWCANTTGVKTQCTPGGYVKNTTALSGGRRTQTVNRLSDIGVNTKRRFAVWMGVVPLQKLKECAKSITTKIGTILATSKRRPNSPEMPTSCIATVSALRSTTGFGVNRAVNALYVGNPQMRQTPHQTGKGDSGWITVITQPEYGRSYATDATLSSKTELQSPYLSEPSSIYAPTLDNIVSITPDGVEDVFDIQVEGTENFIANGIVSHNTRWHPADLIGRLAKDMVRIPESDQYHFFEFPAIFNENTDNEKALWPEFYDLTALHRTKASMPLFQWNAQYQQNPTAEEGALIKREWWKAWEKDKAPACEYIIMTLDAAAEKSNRADFTALLTWGVFSDDELTQSANHIILLNAINTRVEFHELKELALREFKEWQPDAFIVEKKSSGTPLFQELRRMGIPVQEFTPHRGTGDKIARINAVSDIVRSGMVWYPAGYKWAEEVVEQVAAFPAAEHDDMVDCVSMALARFRNGGFIRLDTDEPDEIMYPRKAAYY